MVERREARGMGSGIHRDTTVGMVNREVPHRMSPATKRRILVSIPVILTACAINNEGWEEKPEARPLPAIFVDSSAEQIQRACPTTPHAVGCAVRNYRLGVCYIYVEPDPPKWLAAHEMAHCAGFNHQ